MNFVSAFSPCFFHFDDSSFPSVAQLRSFAHAFKTQRGQRLGRFGGQPRARREAARRIGGLREARKRDLADGHPERLPKAEIEALHYS